MYQLIAGFIVGGLVGTCVTLIIISCIIVGAQADERTER
jgi:hypothetical protein